MERRRLLFALFSTRFCLSMSSAESVSLCIFVLSPLLCCVFCFRQCLDTIVPCRSCRLTSAHCCTETQKSVCSRAEVAAPSSSSFIVRCYPCTLDTPSERMAKLPSEHPSSEHHPSLPSLLASAAAASLHTHVNQVQCYSGVDE